MLAPARRLLSPALRACADRHPPARLLGRRWTRLLLVALVVAVGLAGPWAATAPAAPAAHPASEPVPVSDGGMTPVGAVVLGLIEGITEYLPVSSTGHLAVAQDLLGIGTASEQEKVAADAYAVVIQAGAILAVVVLYRSRLVSLVQGLVGRDEEGRRILIAMVLAVVPIAIVGLALESRIKENLFGVGPVIAAWAAGGVVLLVLSSLGWWERTPGREAAKLETITPVQALAIGGAQCLALWPGTSRSLVTIVAALAVGLSLAAAVEFSFLLGLVALGSATLLDGAKHGDAIIETFGLANPVLGFVVAFVSAVVAVRWMVTYLQRHSLAIFGWYRLGAAVVVGALWWGGVV